MSYIEFNDINSDEVYEDRLVITKRVIGTPTPKDYKVEVPFSSNVIDYSFINGPAYSNRPIQICINLEGYCRAELYIIHSKVLQWLLKPTYSKLKLSDVEGYFMAKVKSISSLEEISYTGNLDISFECLPWRFIERIEYVCELNKLDVISLEGSYMPATPEILVSNVCNIEFEGKTFQLVKGVNKNFDIKFKEGSNEIKLVTDGPISLSISYMRGGL